MSLADFAHLVGEDDLSSRREHVSARGVITQTTSLAGLTLLVSEPVTDSFSGISVVALTPSPIVRSLFPYTVQLTATSPANGFFFAGTPSDPAVSTNNAGSTVTFTFPSNNVYGMGCFFFPSNIVGATIALPATRQIEIVATDVNGLSSLLTISNNF